MTTILLDTGPLVAFLNDREPHHRWILKQFAGWTEPPLTCESVLSEACFLLERDRERSSRVLQLLERGAIRLGFDLSSQQTAVRQLFERYDNVPASLADACLLRMSELHEPCVVVTFDRDFTIYRRHGRKAVPVLMPEELKKK